LYNFVLHTFFLKDIPTDPSGLYWARYIFFLNRIIPVEENFWSNLSAVWSLSSFMLFYLLFPLLAKYINGLFSVILVWLLTICLRVLSIPHINLEPVVMLKYFLFGGVIFYLWKRKDKKLQISMLMMSLCILYYLYTKHLDAWIVVFVAGISILIGSEITIENKLFDRIISLMDEYSYSIYLIHALFIEAIDRYKEHTTNPNWKVMALLVGLFGTIVGSVIVHNIIEKPIQRYVRKRVQL